MLVSAIKLWISYKYTYVPPSWVFLPPPLHLTPLGPHRAPSCDVQHPVLHSNSHVGILHMVEYIIQCYSLNSSHLILPHTVSTSPFFTSVSLFSQLQSCVWLFVIPWTVAHQAPLSMEFSRQEYWSVLPFPSPMSLFLPCK